MIKASLLTIASVSMFSLSAQAAESPNDLNEWVSQAGVAISAKMHFPSKEITRRHIGTNSYEVTIDRQGEIVHYITTAQSERQAFDKASDRALKYVHFPELPAGYSPEQLRFSLNMYYYNTEKDIEKLRQRGSVKGQQIALLPLDNNAADE